MPDATPPKRRTNCRDCGRRRYCIELEGAWTCGDCAPGDVPRAHHATEIGSAEPVRCRHCRHQSARHRVVRTWLTAITIAGSRQQQRRRTLECSSPACGRRFVAVYPPGVDVPA